MLWFLQPVLASSAAGQAEIDPRIWQDFADSPSIPILVRVRDFLELPRVESPADLFKSSELRQVEQRIQVVENSQSSLRSELAAMGTVYRGYWIVNLVSLQADRAVVERLAARSDVVYIESDRSFKVPLETPTTDIQQPAAANAIEPGLVVVHAPELWNSGFKGQGAVVASADTGVDWTHPALQSHYRGWNGMTADHNYSWWDAIKASIVNNGGICGLDSPVPCDDYGHGTHTTGTMVGDDGQGNQIGMAPDAKWIACRNMDGGVGRPSTYIACLQFFLAPTDLSGKNPDPSRRPDVINNSYGCPSTELCSATSLDEAIQKVRDAGIFMAVSAGNSGQSCSTISVPPAIAPGVFTVGAVDSVGNVANFSSRGPVTVNASPLIRPDLVAPGVGVRSSFPGATYVSNMGTSMAAPHVAGAVALLWSAFPNLKRNVTATESLLRNSATPLPVTQVCGETPAGSVPNNTSGWGILNVKNAFDQRLLLKSYLPSINH